MPQINVDDTLISFERNDIEITIRTGKRSVSDAGNVTWQGEKHSVHLTIYQNDKIGAIKEALYQARLILDKALFEEQIHDNK
jgi:hypothetical protein